MNYQVVLWDFDGTLMDTSEGILKSLRYAFGQIGAPCPEEQVLRKFIGPPLIYSLTQYVGMEEKKAEQVVRIFRSHYEAEGLQYSQVYPGAVELIQRLRREGIKIGVASLKPERMVVTLLKRFHIEALFDAAVGSSGEDERGKQTKADIILEALNRMGHTGLSDVVMLGDTDFDGIGAKEAGVDFICAQYGSGMTEERARELNSVMVARSVKDLEDFFFNGL